MVSTRCPVLQQPPEKCHKCQATVQLGHADNKPTGLGSSVCLLMISLERPLTANPNWDLRSGAKRSEVERSGGGFGLSGRPSSPFQPMAAGLEGQLPTPLISVKVETLKSRSHMPGFKWREDADGLDFDLSQDLPGTQVFCQ